MSTWLLSHIPEAPILAAFAAAPGNEQTSGKLQSPQSSAALAANAFGFFLVCPELFPVEALIQGCSEPALSVLLEREMRFPWHGGRHPWLDAAIETETWLIGVESKRYEPFRDRPAKELSEAFRRPIWGDRMRAFEELRDDLMSGVLATHHLDCMQLVKHAFGLRTQAQKHGKRVALVYLYAEPVAWPDGRPVGRPTIERHRAEVRTFAARAETAEVSFVALPYARLLGSFDASPNASVRDHARAIRAHFDV